MSPSRTDANSIISPAPNPTPNRISNTNPNPNCIPNRNRKLTVKHKPNVAWRTRRQVFSYRT